MTQSIYCDKCKILCYELAGGSKKRKGAIAFCEKCKSKATTNDPLSALFGVFK